ncbi:MAG TPA: hypothetical protein VGB18_02645, partial [Candidatus Thermoplasmatota archaeon]
MPSSAEAERSFRRASQRYLVSAVAGVVFLPIALRISTAPWPIERLALLVAFLFGGALVAYAPLQRLNKSHGPRHSLQAYVLAWILFLVVPILVDVLTLPQNVFFVAAASMGAGLSAIATSHRALQKHFDPPSDTLRTTFVVAFAVLILLASQLLWNTFSIAYGVLAVAMASSLRTLTRVPDPIHSGTSPFGVYLPWRLDAGNRPPLDVGWWTRFPAHLVYTFGTVILFAVWIIVFETDRSRVPAFLTWTLVYEVPNLFADMPRTVVNLATGTWFNHHPIQVIYVFSLLALFGIWFEIHEG